IFFAHCHSHLTGGSITAPYSPTLVHSGLLRHHDQFWSASSNPSPPPRRRLRIENRPSSPDTPPSSPVVQSLHRSETRTMRSSILSAAAVLAGLHLVNGQTFSDCNPVKGDKCDPKSGLGTTITTDFTQKSDDWREADGTSLKYGSNGAEFTISKKTDAPTIAFDKYIFFGKVSVTMRSSPGQGTVSSFILESDVLDEIDWEWLGSDDRNVQSNFFGKGNTTTYDRGGIHPVATPIETFTTYSIDWTKDAIKWYIGDTLVRTLAYNDPKTLGGSNYPQTPMRVKMGSWIGCLDAADPKTQGTCEWAGGAIDLTKGPYTMYVQSVTIQDYGCGGQYSYSDTSGSYQSIKSTGSCDGKPDPEVTSTAPSSYSTKNGGILVQTSATLSANVTKPTGTGYPAAGNETSHGASTATGASSGYGAVPTSTGVPMVSTNAAPRHQSGRVELGVMALGLGLGYLVV
ncbi:Crh-like protein, partial [Diplocarpon rosae]